ncbi:F-box protein GID2-like [Impatiens glandulifera]|uniref:F-box protein GID2-like n=1 Tax=Impatiens glandulifera TaxID=253017 RepID=UPI001FB04FD7|nr:F-box protein GID2-like [Impatiens glandulifera]
MKRPIDSDSDHRKMKRVKSESDQLTTDNSVKVLTDENLLFEVLKHADARTLATAACVSKKWSTTAQDERLWELICTKHIGSGNHQLRSVVLALGGFRRLHSLYLLPLSKPSSSSSSSSSSSWPCIPEMPNAKRNVTGAGTGAGGSKARWGKDEVHLSLSLLSIRYYEKMNSNYRGK